MATDRLLPATRPLQLTAKVLHGYWLWGLVKVMLFMIRTLLDIFVKSLLHVTHWAADLKVGSLCPAIKPFGHALNRIIE